MTQDIFEAVAADTHSHIITFRTSGAGVPLFCFPGSGGDVHVFQEMIAALPEGQPVYAIDMEWLCQTLQDFTIERLAAFYLDLIRKIQKHGPYYLCGYSFGGLVAYEIATQLVDDGDSAKLVALLDAPNPAQMLNLSATESVHFRKTYLIDRLKRYGHHLIRGEVKAFTGRGLAFITSRAGRFFIPAIKVALRMMGKPLPRTLRTNDPGFLKAWSSYIPKCYPRSVVCFRVENRGPEHDRDPSMGWSACVMGGVKVHVVPGGHVDMMITPSVCVVADNLAAYLDSSSNGKEVPAIGESPSSGIRIS